ncbi:MAG TPA: response regulator [Ohtaekwangia sp.]|nr:response regulator [Ohtaekwangia sp.]
MTILYLDDDTDDLDLVRETIHEIDPSISCMIASTDTQAYQMLQGLANPPDCIFVDLHLQSINGVAFIKELKLSARYKRVPVVMLSSVTNQFVIDKCRELGADFVQKPSSLDAWKKTLSSILIPDNNSERKA